jgi:hypothetical protein
MVHGLARLDKGIIKSLFDTIDRTSGGACIGQGSEKVEYTVIEVEPKL